MKGMILAAGLGTRLHPLTAFRPKPAIPFLNRPFLHYTMELLLQARVKDIVINLHHLPKEIEAAAQELVHDAEGQDRTQIHFSYESEILGTAGAIGKVKDLLSGDPFVVCNGKIYFEEDLSRAIAFHEDKEATVTLVLVRYREDDTFDPVIMDNQNNIIGFGRSKQQSSSHLPYVFTGVHILSPSVLEHIPKGPSDTVGDLYPLLIEKGDRVKGFVSEAFWCECSTPRRYLSKSMEVLARKNLENLITDGSQVPGQGVVAGESVELDRSSVLQNCVLWDHISVPGNSSLSNVIIASGIELEPDTRLTNAIVTPRIGASERSGDVQARVEGNHLVWPL